LPEVADLAQPLADSDILRKVHPPQRNRAHCGRPPRVGALWQAVINSNKQLIWTYRPN
jgi:hypothetical protein